MKNVNSLSVPQSGLARIVSTETAMRRTVLLVIVVLGCASTVRGEPMLFAKYDWQNGATDVSGSPIRHDGVLDNGASIADGKLVVRDCDGVNLGHMPELDGARQVLLRFEDVTFEEGCLYSVLAGGAAGDPMERRRLGDRWLVRSQ